MPQFGELTFSRPESGTRRSEFGVELGESRTRRRELCVELGEPGAERRVRASLLGARLDGRPQAALLGGSDARQMQEGIRRRLGDGAGECEVDGSVQHPAERSR